MSVYIIIAIVFFALALIGLAITVMLFFNLDIYSVIGDLTGATAKKQIEQIRTQNQNISYGAHKKKKTNHSPVIDNMISDSSADSRVRAQAHSSKQLGRRERVDSSDNKFTEKSIFNAQPANGTVSLENLNTTDSLGSSVTDRLNNKKAVYSRSLSESETGVLSNEVSEAETGVLSNEVSEAETGVLSNEVSEAETGVLSDDVSEAETGVLSNEINQTILSDSREKEFHIADDISETPTDILEDETPTDLLDDETPTGVLSDEGNNDLADYDAPTGVLSDADESQTAVLNNDKTGFVSSGDKKADNSFSIISDETTVFTDEEIE